MQVRLVLTDGIDDHPRPKDPRVRFFTPPLSQVALWLYESTGDVVVMDRMPDPDETNPPDALAGGGVDWYGDSESWQALALEAAGYDLIAVED